MPVVQPSTQGTSLRGAMEARDVAAIIETFAPDAVVHSPFTSTLCFRGPDEIAVLMTVIAEVVEDLHYTAEVRTGNVGFLVSEARIGGQDIEMIDQIRFNTEDKIEDLTVFVRPLPGATAALRVIGAGLGRQRSKVRGRVISFLVHPMALMSRVGDGLGARLVRPALRR